jgi:hypothetical protein
MLDKIIPALDSAFETPALYIKASDAFDVHFRLTYNTLASSRRIFFGYTIVNVAYYEPNA